MVVLRFPNPFLSTATREVTVFGEELKILLDSMYEVMRLESGIGLAANQVGLLYKMFVMDGPAGRLNIVNPIVVSMSGKSANTKEGCLSVPGEFILVPSRVEWIQLRYKNESGADKSIVLKGIHSVCAQHELDHLQGKIFMYDKSIPRYERKRLAKKWRTK
jgi:peptide deformylase